MGVVRVKDQDGNEFELDHIAEIQFEYVRTVSGEDQVTAERFGMKPIPTRVVGQSVKVIQHTGVEHQFFVPVESSVSATGYGRVVQAVTVLDDDLTNTVS